MSNDAKIESDTFMPRESRARAFLARLLTVGLIIAVPAMVIQMGLRWAKVREPTTAVLFSGDGSLDGATVKVTSVWDPNNSRTASLDQADGWQAPVLLEPGKYHVVVTHRDRKILDDVCEPDRMTGVRFELPSMVMIRGDATLAGAKIEIRRRSDDSIAYGFEIKLTPEDHFRTPIHLHSGDYRAIARNNSGDVTRQDFTVDRTEKVVVDLRPHVPSNAD